MKENINVICIKWGNSYTADDVNHLFASIKKYTSKNIKFYCFTELPDDLDEQIMVFPLPKLNISSEYAEIANRYSYKKEAALCENNLAGLNGERVFFFDLDVLITNNLDDLFNMPKNDEFYIIQDWNFKNKTVGNASFYSWVVGSLDYVKKDFENDPMKWIKKYGTASQEYLSYKVIEKFGSLNFWPINWISSYKRNCIPNFFLRFFVTPKLPKDTKLLVFHGRPKAYDALLGRWYPPSYPVPKWKKMLKYIKPAIWINDFLGNKK